MMSHDDGKQEAQQHSEQHSEQQRQQASWVANADAWTTAVREGQIASRRNGTDAAIVAACRPATGMRVLDVGCGEGWLARALAERGAQVTGVDASAPLVAAARTATRAGDAATTFDVASYDALATRPDVVPGPFDLVVCNFALLDQDLVPLLRGLSARLAPAGRLLIQTVHPFAASGGIEHYSSAWREEQFTGFGDGFSAPMPWYFRTFQAWFTTLRDSGLVVRALEEPRTSSGALLSLILELVPA